MTSLGNIERDLRYFYSIKYISLGLYLKVGFSRRIILDQENDVTAGRIPGRNFKASLPKNSSFSAMCLLCTCRFFDRISAG